ncbi:transglycosylase SLT domain-containing protein [Pseudooceanicola aestuarii]|uniref:transglycosylase SLT domain-containing protein n=1 Tax=Pseudooceanicola aestuarii TaxID=2697319 RepID=UPI001EF7E475|nr:transglycosylase SLT domain-containing protein [Pseudooceanicola aestuarii]
MRRALPMIALALLIGQGAVAQADWRGFYRPTAAATPRVQPAPADGAPPSRAAAQGVCVREILLAQLRHAIPDNLLLGIGLQEAGMTHEGQHTIWPWTANSDGDGRFFASRAAARDWVQSELDRGVRSVDIGCMQINLRWHPEAFATVDDGLDPAANVDYAARLLLRHHRNRGSWAEAAAAYHSGTPDVGAGYLARLDRNVATANSRIAAFRDLAARAVTLANAPAPRTGPLRSPRPARGGPAWTSWLTTAEAGAHSLTASAALQPLFGATFAGGRP